MVSACLIVGTAVVKNTKSLVIVTSAEPLRRLVINLYPILFESH